MDVKYTPEQKKAFATLLDKIEELRLPHFDPIRYLTTADERENRLSGIYRFVLLKRAESSMHAFALSLAALASKAQVAYEQLEKVNDAEASIASWLRRRYKLEEAVDDDEFDREATAEVLPPLKRQTGAYTTVDRSSRATWRIAGTTGMPFLMIACMIRTLFKASSVNFDHFLSRSQIRSCVTAS